MTTTPEKTGASTPVAEDLVTLTIDGVQVSVPKDTLVIRAAEQVGVQIPRFCDHPLLAPVGACRQCLVDVPDAGNGRGFPKPQASCTITVAEGMVVNTQATSPVADKAQQGIMEFLLINHPLDCPVCDKGGECPLQNQAMSNGRAESRFSPPGAASSGPTPSRSTSPPRCCSTGSAACCAPDAPASPSRSPATPSSP
ncbi:2Fe-2S iron-sulfur cluster-binding protein [Nocardioides ungokensis]|uniref:2Fe-2S iron-sulfur cluster-binding protein n=1 Tax=Nocardioides ungokensis TaxID=1643322 RepID=UPI001FE5A1DB|nr:2Fe-2S iron-sulfur cluster-binding protein [Nocardioides ungokensis]